MDNIMQKMPVFDGKTEIFKLDDEGMMFRLTNESGDISQICYQVFPGIEMIYNNIHMPHNMFNIIPNRKNMIEIDHCREGRLECQVGGNYFYLSPGDVLIHRIGETMREEIFPTSHYHGITVQIDFDKSPDSLSGFLEDVNVKPAAIVKKFHLEENFFFALRQMPAIEHIFSELYSVPESIKKGYFKVKILELFLFLSSLKPEEHRLEQRCFSETQVILAKKVCNYLEEHLGSTITMAKLADYFQISIFQIKNSFEGVYGTSVHSYMKNQKMKAAAKLLRETNRTVLDIAGQVGYENGSKFASAFRDVMGVTPTQYRNGLFHTE